MVGDPVCLLGVLVGPRHYLLLNQGTFDLWHLSGLQTSFVSNVSLGLTKKVDATWTGLRGHQCWLEVFQMK